VRRVEEAGAPRVSFEEYLSEFAGLPVVEFPTEPEQPVPDVEPDAVAWRIRLESDYDGDAGEDFAERFRAFLDEIDTTRVAALVIGMTGFDCEFDGAIAVERLTEHAAAFPALRALFFADVLREESDVAYIEHKDLMPLFAAFPRLEEFRVRGGYHFRPGAEPFRPFAHPALRTLVFESGGLPPEVFRAVGESDLPQLEHLEFYFGYPDYGGGAGVEDIAWLLSGEKFPRLRHLGLRDAPNQDEIAGAVAHAPVVARLEVLDLSLGELGDEGAAALLAGQPLTHLKRLDLHHHFLSDAMAERLASALPGVDLDVSEPAELQFWGGAEHRYIAIGE
jgi:hypothetical protein